MKRILLCGSLLAALVGCGSGEEYPPSLNLNGLTDTQQIAYDQCLLERQAEAVAIELIEQSCKDNVTGATDPLDLSQDTED